MLSPNQARIHSFRVVPSLPEPLRPLLEIARNLWWSWNYEAVNLFVRLDRDVWEASGHNPVAMLGMISQERLERAAADRSYVHLLGTVHSQLVEHLNRRCWYHESVPVTLDRSGAPFRVAYFCAEFGLTECLQIYSGGLGVLAGDHLKSASELGIPLVAVGLLYRKGYFHQYLNSEGYQQETYAEVDPANQPLQRLLDPRSGQPRTVTVDLPGRSVAIGVWRCDVGNVRLYLLDTNLPENSREDREITANLYGGDVEMRIKQEVVLGIGGVRALRALGEEPTVFHINEGHAAFLALERIRELRAAHHVTFDQAREAAAAAHIFTTHTPVPAGIDRFSPSMIESYFGGMVGALGLDTEGLLALGRENTADRKEHFSMAVLAIRTSRFQNGVSRLHGVVSRSMWRSMWPGTPVSEVPIGSVTNGIHGRSWVSPEMARLYDRYLGEKWQTDPADPETWDAVRDIPDEELWAAHQRRREHMIAWARKRLRAQLVARGAGGRELEQAGAALDLDMLTVGFARRFATYKRGTLLLRDPDRLARVLHGERPIQVLIAGKAHPADGGGKQLIREIVEFARATGNAHRIVFLEDYDIEVARRLVQGCDLWLNTPVHGMEASGTSGMKAAINGVIHCSIRDGWWHEAFDPELGFAIGRGEAYEGLERSEQDDLESRMLYQLLENHIVPEFYDRDSGGVPRRWVARMKRCIQALAPRFSTHRMVAEYTRRFYFPAHNTSAKLAADGLRQACDLAAHVDHYRRHWGDIRIEQVQAGAGPDAAVPVRASVEVSATVHLGALRPEEVRVQLYHGTVSSLGELIDGESMSLRHDADLGEGRHRFAGRFAPLRSGQHGFSVRVLPHDDRLVSSFVPGLITWDTGAAEPAQVVATT